MNEVKITIGKREVCGGEPVFVIAEAGVNHNGSLEAAKKLIEVAAEAGADAVKFQTFKAEALATTNAPKAEYQLQTTGRNESQLEMLRHLELSHDAHRDLRDYCDQNQLTFLSTPFDEASADFLDTLGMTAFKISSGDLTNLPLLDHVARKGKPLILSTGMATMEDVAAAVGVVRGSGCDRMILLQCVSNYPAKPEDVNLRAMKTMQEEFDLPVGFSDHTQGIDIALAAVALGAVVIEKHFTLDKNMAGPDHRASLDPTELKTLIQSIRRVEVSLGDGRKRPAASEEETARVARRSVIAARRIPAGTLLVREMIALKRPGSGLPPSMVSSLLGRKSRVEIAEGHMLQLDMFD